MNVKLDGGYCFQVYRLDTYAAYFYPVGGDGRGRYLGDTFPSVEAAQRAVAERRARR